MQKRQKSLPYPVYMCTRTSDLYTTSWEWYQLSYSDMVCVLTEINQYLLLVYISIKFFFLVFGLVEPR